MRQIHFGGMFLPVDEQTGMGTSRRGRALLMDQPRLELSPDTRRVNSKMPGQRPVDQHHPVIQVDDHH
jgi:hypothetical protein